MTHYFTAKKLAADAKSRARKSNKVADYPNPDLAIEIDISPSEVDRPAIYAALQGPRGLAIRWRVLRDRATPEGWNLCCPWNRAGSCRSAPRKSTDGSAVEDTSDDLGLGTTLARVGPRRAGAAEECADPIRHYGHRVAVS